MPREILYATGFFEVGDVFYDDQNQMHTITDVLVCHYLKRGIYKVLYEVDNSKEFIELKMSGFDSEPEVPQKKKTNKPPLQIMSSNTSEGRE